MLFSLNAVTGAFMQVSRPFELKFCNIFNAFFYQTFLKSVKRTLIECSKLGALAWPWASEDFFPHTICLKNAKKDTIFLKKVKNILFWSARG
jgi:hypothetical protein